MTGQVFEAPAALGPGITDSWIKASWLDMVTHNISLKSDIPDFPVPREGDQELMRTFLRAGFCKEELATLNRCHMHSRMIFTSNICTGAGDQVDGRWLQGTICRNHEQYSWPKTGAPTEEEWTLWDCTIKVAYNLDNRL